MKLICDSGSTRASWRGIASDGKIFSWQSEGLHPFFRSEDQIMEVLHHQLLSGIGFPNPQTISEIHFYGAGCANLERAKPIVNALGKIFSSSEIHVESDLLGACRGMLQHEKGLAVILGTGCNAALYDGERIIENRPSLGYILGDEGSGAWIGKEILNAFYYDQMPEELAKAFRIEHENDLEFVLENVYRKPLANRFLASYAKFAGKHKEHPFIHKLIVNGFVSFCSKHLLFYPGENLPVSAVGSIAFHFREYWNEALDQIGLKPGNTAESPIEGLVSFHKQDISA